MPREEDRGEERGTALSRVVQVEYSRVARLLEKKSFQRIEVVRRGAANYACLVRRAKEKEAVHGVQKTRVEQRAARAVASRPGGTRGNGAAEDGIRV